MAHARDIPFLKTTRRTALSLNTIALLVGLYGLLLQPHALTLSLAVGFGLSIFAVLARQAAWIAALAVVFCLFVGVISAVASFSLWFSDAWFESAAVKAKLLGALLLLGAVGPLTNVYVLYGLYSRQDSPG